MNEETMISNIDDMSKDYATVNRNIPYGLIAQERDDSAKDLMAELTEIYKYYSIYKNGAKFTTEGSNSDYISAQKPYKLAASLINKEARFLFAESPSINVVSKSDSGKITDATAAQLTDINDMVRTILDDNNFEEQLIKAARDCFIGKRVACLVNFNVNDGVTVSFLPSTHFMYTYKRGCRTLEKFVAYIVIQDSLRQTNRIIFRKRYTLVDNIVYLEETTHDGTGVLLEEITPLQSTLLKTIPAVVILNDGLTGDNDGESEIANLSNDESWYSKLASADIDAQRKGMNPVKYVVDMESNSTQNLSTAAGAFWDLGTDQELEKPASKVGMLEPAMSYSNSLTTTLDRVKKSAYDQLDMPDIDSLQATITSGKALKAIYWGLIIRCQEKMKTWSPALRNIINIIINGAIAYPDTVLNYINAPITPVDYKIIVEGNIPIPEDEIEKKTIDIAEVNNNTMSRKAYMKKWRDLSDDEVDAELQQIALERQMIDDSTFNMA